MDIEKYEYKSANSKTHPDQFSGMERIDNNLDDDLDDIVINNISMFRMERMSDTCFWVRLHRKRGDDIVFFLNAIPEPDSKVKIQGDWHFDGRELLSSWSRFVYKIKDILGWS